MRLVGIYSLNLASHFSIHFQVNNPINLLSREKSVRYIYKSRTRLHKSELSVPDVLCNNAHTLHLLQDAA